ncbi:MAG: hypoxanthine phosphoribosyltransferase [Candidatus Carbobacillus altaicus]|uniref:Hypoxanthine phosphoribosyltransferase n=1 Tax=Candidatus Carbonibacillus altaicus TaxID=2163959 RepID=A0A2R6Y1K7_9BACL|nr:hypoxanthine phosphoribosyltransferase [Candidatus Carbobacillus altaicus]PTQ56564.1 MAG: Hypoxanthine-guanine phosphoribosyltransferase [Candidatus Carbobacillus altaicus]
MHDIAEVLLTPEEIQNRVKALGRVLEEVYRDKNPLLVGVLKGAAPFMVDLARQMDIALEMDYMVVSSYGQATQTSGVVKIIKDLDFEIEGRHVLIVEDIIDSGLTLNYLTDLIKRRTPASIAIVTFLDKPRGRKVAIEADYVGFTVPDAFVVGYGLDFAEKYRNLPFVGVLKPEIYSRAR